jgi:hypothetical protein
MAPIVMPSDLKVESFAGYPPEARRRAAAHLAALQQLPLAFAPSLLREIIEYDYKFPAERASIDHELDTLSSLTPAQRKEWFQAFAQFSLSGQLQSLNWVDQPGVFVEQLSAYLWSTHQLDGFRNAATDYGNRLRTASPAPLAPVRRLGIAVVGQGVATWDAPLFRNFRPHGTYFTQIKPENGLNLLLAAAAGRAKAHPNPYGHWYVDGGEAVAHSAELTCISYQALDPLRAALLKTMQRDINQPGMGPEELRTRLARMTPADLGIASTGSPVLDRFQLKLFTEGSGTQIFSTTFAQWTAREVLRRAQADTLLVRFAPRQRQRSMNEMLANSHAAPELDPAGSLVDAEMGAYYQWINQQRLPDSEHSTFVVWFEGHNQALAISPTLPRGSESNSSLDLSQLVALAAS